MDKSLGWVFRPFNRVFTSGANRYVGGVKRVLRAGTVTLMVYGGLVALGFLGFAHVPTGFVPQQDKQYLVAFAQLPDAASLDRTEDVIRRMREACGQSCTTSANQRQPRIFSAISFTLVSIGTASSAPGMPHSQPHTSSHSRIAMGLRRMRWPWINGVTTLPSNAVMPAKVSAGSKAALGWSKLSRPTTASTAVVLMAPT